MRISWYTGLLSLVTAAVFMAGCGGDTTNAPAYKDKIGKPVPAFSLVDVNPSSATYDRVVSPRDYLDKISAWYFGSAT